jgi:predicted secreted protein
MGFWNLVFVYLLVWWVMLFTVLPIGVERNADTGKGHDAGAPVHPMLKKKIILNSALSAVIVAVIWLLVYFHIIRWDEWFRDAIK